jgi:hypothetical protein
MVSSPFSPTTAPTDPLGSEPPAPPQSLEIRFPRLPHGNSEFLPTKQAAAECTARDQIPSLYAQDTFHATKRLTVTAGLRWAPNAFMPVDVFNRGVVFNMANFLANKVSSVYPNAPAGATFYGDPGVPRQFTKNSPWQFAPNLGLSYRSPTALAKLSCVAGMSLGYDQVNFFTAQRNQQNPPYATAISQQQSPTAPISFSSPWSVGAITTNPFPQAQVPTPATAEFFAQSQYIFLPTAVPPVLHRIQWTASVQQ